MEAPVMNRGSVIPRLRKKDGRINVDFLAVQSKPTLL